MLTNQNPVDVQTILSALLSNPQEIMTKTATLEEAAKKNRDLEIAIDKKQAAVDKNHKEVQKLAADVHARELQLELDRGAFEAEKEELAVLKRQEQEAYAEFKRQREASEKAQRVAQMELARTLSSHRDAEAALMKLKAEYEKDKAILDQLWLSINDKWARIKDIMEE